MRTGKLVVFKLDYDSQDPFDALISFQRAVRRMI